MPAKKKAPAKKAATKRGSSVKKPAAKKKVVKKVVKKTAAKKAPAKKAVAKKAPAKAAGKPLKSVSSPLTKSQLHAALSDATGLSKKEISGVFDALADLVQLHVKKRGPQVFTLPGLLKIKVVRKPATKARKGINPFTGEETIFKAKPARNAVKVLPLKNLKEMAN